MKDEKKEQTEQNLWCNVVDIKEHKEKSIITKEDDLASTDPFNVGMMNVLDGYNNDIDAVDVDKILLSTLEEIENKQQSSHSDKSAIKINEKIELNKVDEEMMVVEGEGSLNVLKEPIMRLTEEETNRLQLLINDTQFTLRQCCPVFLFQADMGAMIDFFGSSNFDCQEAISWKKKSVKLSQTTLKLLFGLFHKSSNISFMPGCRRGWDSSWGRCLCRR